MANTKRKSPITSREAFAGRLVPWAESPPLSVALVDVDGFKLTNDAHGRDAGNRLLDRVLRALRSKTEHVSRIGGDEFACAMPDTSPEQALLRLEAVRAALERDPMTAGRRKIPVRISAGIASFPQHAEDPSQLLQAADEALHRGRREGKGRIAIYVEDKMVLKSNYYSRAQLARLSDLAATTGRREAALLREALGDLFDKYREAI